VDRIVEHQASRTLERLFDSWYSPLLRFAKAATGRLDVAEDLVQDAFLDLYAQILRGRTIHKPEGWLFVVVRRAVHRHWRSTAKEAAMHSLFEEIDMEAGQTSQNRHMEDGVHRMDVMSLLTVLTERERDVLMLRLGSLAYKDIAGQLGISVSSVNTLLSRAVSKLRKAQSKQNRRGRFNVATAQFR